MNLKNKGYALDVICAVEHLEKILTERVPLGDRGQVTADIIDRLVFGQKNVEFPEIEFRYAREVK